MSWTSNPKTLCITTMAAIFLCGGAVGALAMNFAIHRNIHKQAFWTDTGRTAYIERVKKDLELTPAQVDQLEMILDDFSKYYRTVLADGKSRLMQVLNERQKKKFEEMMMQERPRK